jgi:uncharacterized protein
MLNSAYPSFIPGVVGPLQILVDHVLPTTKTRGIAVIAHPHPQMGGTLHNKVVHTLAKTLSKHGYVAVRFNYRGVEQSAGTYDHGRGEVEDYLAVLHWAMDFFQHSHWWAAGFSFGSYIAASATLRLPAALTLQGTWLIAPPIARMHFDTLPALPMPTYVVQGTEDEVVDAQDTYTWCAARSQQVQLMKLEQAGHFFHKRLTDLQQLLSPTLTTEQAT